MAANKRRLYLHIGSEKSGTTSVQSVLASNSEAVRRSCGVYYPVHAPLFCNNAHFPVAAAFLRPDQIDFIEPKDRITAATVIESLGLLAEQTDYSALVLSDEHFSSRFGPRQIPPLRLALEKALPGFDVCVLFSVRSQPSLYCAAKSTHFRCGGTNWDPPKSILRDSPYYNVWLNASAWGHEFGVENIRILNFHAGDAVTALLTAIGVPLDAVGPVQLMANRSISYEEMQALEIIGNHLGAVDITDWDEYARRVDLTTAMLNYLQTLRIARRPISASLTRDDYQHFLAEFAEDNDKLQHAFKLDFNLNDDIRAHAARASDKAGGEMPADELTLALQRAEQAEAGQRRAEQHLDEILSSTTWKFTSPLRKVIDGLKWCCPVRTN